MSFINTIDPQQATDEVAALYERQQGHSTYLPNYARVFCHRPGIMAPISALQKEIAAGMPARLWALLSLAVAREIKVSYCTLAYARRLMSRHFSKAQLLAILGGSETAPISAAERAAMAVAVKMARDSSSVTQSDIDGLRDCGYSEVEIFDIIAAAAYRCFFAKIPDALGAQPDAALGELDDRLLDELVVGRAVEVEERTELATGVAPVESLQGWERGEFA